jgi:hypothetical protein
MATTFVEADACRDQVKYLFCAPDGGLMADSGACVGVKYADGGAL